MDPTDITDPGWLDSVLGAADAAPSSDGGSGMPEWLDGILGTVGDVAETAGGVIGTIYTAKGQADQQRAQQAYMAQLAQTNSVLASQSNRQALYIGAALLMFVLLLRQTAQAR
ncbi:hypothetical protein A6A04_08980 [Paramagnetospirillum marisnigri]|uniref:Uncharacterized protein n=1 Tax=Paramagnetospirillum marisnigri TaxID=1285242 RepID=A0A178M7I7_9PROT|nr:hypothetical protein [Paramagnetospirillum marisnigri]OAN44005.1 hypothetical protein A6A04_08980 [Paramagnetospirillum marisnigri]